MKKLILTLAIILFSGIYIAKGQNVPSTPDPATSPTQQDTDIDPAGPDQKNIEFPPDVVDSSITDTSEIRDVRVDSTRMEEKTSMEDKDSLMNQKDTIRNNWDNSGIPKKKNKKKK